MAIIVVLIGIAENFWMKKAKYSLDPCARSSFTRFDISRWHLGNVSLPYITMLSCFPGTTGDSKGSNAC